MRTYKERTERVLRKAEIQKTKRRKTIKLISVLSCAAAVILTLNLVLFVPYTVGGIDVSKYSGSEYYPVIQKLSGLTYSAPRKTNNYREWGLSQVFELPKYGAGNDATGVSPESPDLSGGNGSYNEVTNNQTSGVIEGDLFKRSDRYVFYLDYRNEYTDVIIDEKEDGSYTKEEVYCPERYILRVYSIAGLASEAVAEFDVYAEEGTTFKGYYGSREMYLSSDCNTLTLLSPCYNEQVGLLYTAVIGIDVSNVGNIREIQRSYISGQYVSSRVADGSLLMISNFTVRYRPDFSDEKQFLPQTGSLDDLKSVPIGNIVLPDSVSSAKYTVITALDAYTFEVTDCVALLSYSDEVYVSAENLFVTRGFAHYDAEAEEIYYSATEIYCVGYGDGLEQRGSVTVTGSIKDRYCMDEYEGVLRVATSTEIYYQNGGATASADLYCIDLGSFEIIASEVGFAPNGESVQSARFYGNTAYVCTALTYIVPTDPVFMFDLSDYANITYKDTGTIPGYSLSLISFTDGTLLGIGYGDSLSFLKIELYGEGEDDLLSVAKYELMAEFSKEFKAYFIDAERGLIGLGVKTGASSDYLLLRFDGYQLVKIAEVPFDVSDDDMRACFIDGYLYLFGGDLFEVITV